MHAVCQRSEEIARAYAAWEKLRRLHGHWQDTPDTPFPIPAARGQAIRLQCCKRLLQIGNDIINMLRADGKANGAAADAHIRQFFIGQLGMGGGCGMDHQNLDIRHVGQQGEHLQLVNEPEGLRLPPLDLKGENGSTTVRKVLLIQGMIRMVRQAGMIDPGYLRMPYPVWRVRPTAAPAPLSA